MQKKEICIIAQFPPPIHGLSKAVDTLYHSKSNDEFVFDKVNITNNRTFFKNIMFLIKCKADLFYLTISQSKGGNIRDLILMGLLRIRGKKCIIHLHGGYFRNLVDQDLSVIQKHFNYWLIKKTDGVIVLSNSFRAIFKGMIRDDKIFVVPNCVDNQYLLDNEQFQNKVSLIDSIKIHHVLYLSNFNVLKGYREVLNLAKAEKQECQRTGNRRFHFDFAGKFFDENEQLYFYSFIKEHQLENYITYHGIVDGDQKMELLRDSTIFILLTRYKKEGQPISILEAMGNGMAIVTTDHAGIPDLIQDGVNGIVVEHFDMQELYNKMSNIVVTSDLSSYILKNRNDILSDYLEKTYIDNMHSTFHAVL